MRVLISLFALVLSQVPRDVQAAGLVIGHIVYFDDTHSSCPTNFEALDASEKG